MIRSALLALTAAAFLTAATRLHGALAWLVCTPLILGVARADGLRGAGTVGALFGVTAALGGHGGWVAAAGQQYFELSWPQAAAAVLLLAVPCGTLLGAVLGVGLRCAVQAAGPSAALSAGAVWAAWEWLTTAVLPYYPWASLASTQADLAVPLQIAGLLGQAGLSFCIAAAGGSLALALLARGHPRGAFEHLSVCVAIILLGTAFGYARLAAEERVPASTCSIRTVDAGISSPAAPLAEIVDRYEAATAQPSPAAKFDAVAWPESALLVSPELDGALQARLRALAHRLGTVLIAGGPRLHWSGNWQPLAFNSAYRIQDSGALEAYDKRVLVPFAEYWPAIGVARPAWLATQEVAPGTEPALFAAGACRLGVLICFEGQHAHLARELAHAGADILLVVSNDAQLPQEAVSLQISQLRLRAVETGVPVVRAANKGISASIDRFGRIQQMARGGTLDIALAPGEPAPAVRAAPLFLSLCWGMTVAAFALATRRQRPRSTIG